MTRTAVILARGLGTRLRTHDGTALGAPAERLAAAGLKALMPVDGRPLLLHQVERLRAAGISRLVLVIGPEHRELRQVAADISGMDVALAVQAQPRGTADAVTAAAPHCAGPALVLNGDTLYPVAALRAAAAAPGAAVVGFTRQALAAGGITAQRIAAFALIERDVAGKLRRIIEKPSADQQAHLGAAALVGMNLWRLTPDLLAACATVPPSPRGELELPLAMQQAVANGTSVQVIEAGEPIHDLTARGDLGQIELRLRLAKVHAGLAQQAATRFGAPAQAAWWVPGRIELLGKHTDYAGGPSLTCATAAGIAVLACRNEGQPGLRISSAHGTTRLDLPLPMAATAAAAPSGLEHYAGAVLRRLARDFPGAHTQVGVEISLASDLPMAAGLSSSSALVVGIATAIAWAWRLDQHPAWAGLADPLDLATYWSCLENGKAFAGFAADGGVGTAGGSEDHVAITCAQPGQVQCYRYAPVQREAQPAWPTDTTLLVANSGVLAEKTGAARERYNACATLHAQALATWNRSSGRCDAHLAAAAQAAGADAVLAALPTAQRQRAAHLFAESALVRRAVAALERGDVPAFAQAVDASQAAAEQLLGNQVPQTIALCQQARQAGALCATSFGAGFGGAVWALAPSTQAARIATHWQPLAHGPVLAMQPALPLHRMDLP